MKNVQGRHDGAAHVSTAAYEFHWALSVCHRTATQATTSAACTTVQHMQVIGHGHNGVTTQAMITYVSSGSRLLQCRSNATQTLN
jgi:hypothetical protein